ncbi:BgTH12-06302, partial [Blumeria graminis f. sp. triticale]
ATLTCLCNLVCSCREIYSLPVFHFSSELGIQATQTLIRGDNDQETDQNTFHHCLFLECRSQYPKSLPRRPRKPLNRKHSKNVRPRMHICDLITRSSHTPTACPPSRCEAPFDQRTPIDQDPSFVDYDLISSSRVYIAS